MEEKIQSHSLCLEEQKKLTVNGVISVDSFSEQSITATLIRNKLTIGGEGLKIVAFSKNTGAEAGFKSWIAQNCGTDWGDGYGNDFCTDYGTTNRTTNRTTNLAKNIPHGTSQLAELGNFIKDVMDIRSGIEHDAKYHVEYNGESNGESNVEYNVSGSELKSTDTYSYQKPLKTKGTKTRINIGKKVEKESVKKESTDKKSVKDTGIAKRYVSVKTNFAYWAGAVANLSADIQLHRKLSLELPFDWSLWDIEREHGVRLVLFQPEVRWWMKNVGKGHFVGVHAHAGVFNVKWKDIRYQTAGRPLLGAGLTYGYSLPFSEHWGAEFLLGVGYANMKFDEFYNIDNGAKICTDELNYWGITKLGISLVYRF